MREGRTISWKLVLTAGILGAFFAVLFGCGGGGGGGGEESPPPEFSQADLTGNWDGLQFVTGANSGWYHVKATVDSAGNITLTDYLDSDGNTQLPGSFILTIGSNGIVSSSGVNGNTTFHGNMSPDKKLVIGTENNGSSTKFRMYVLRKRAAGVTFSDNDVRNIPFAYYGLYSGGDNTWEYGTGSTNSTGQITLSSRHKFAGDNTLPTPNNDMFQIDSNGVVTRANDNSFYGFMTTDKKVIFSTNTDNAAAGSYRFTAFLVTGQTYVEADVAGTVDFHRVDSGITPAWAHGTFTNDNVGSQTYSSYLDSTGSTTLPGPYIVTIDNTGAITRNSSTSFHGHMDFNKTLTIRVQNQGAGSYGMAVNLKR